jgi:hypothetical protein
LLIGEGSEYRPFQILGSCHKANRLSGGLDCHKADRLSGGLDCQKVDRLSGGAEKPKGSTLRPCTCIKKWTFSFMIYFYFFMQEIYKNKVLKTKRLR